MAIAYYGGIVMMVQALFANHQIIKMVTFEISKVGWWVVLRGIDRSSAANTMVNG